MFIERSNNVSSRIESINSQIGLLKKNIEKTRKTSITSKEIKDVIDAYYLSDIKEKNELLKSVLFKVEYKKERNQRNDEFDIKLFPKIYI